MTEVPSIEDLLAPLSFPSFVETYYGSQPYRASARDQAMLARICDTPAIERILWANEDRLADIAEVEGGRLRPQDIRALEARRPLDALHARFATGSTVRVRDIGHLDASAAAFQRGLEFRFQASVHIDAVLTPSGISPQALSYAAADRLFIQLGAKRDWWVYGELVKAPLDEQVGPVPPAFVEGRETALPLDTGDVLYLPAGHVAMAAAGPGTALHLEVSIRRMRWADLLHRAVDLIAQGEPDLRAPLPFDAQGQVMAQMAAAGQRLAAKLSDPSEAMPVLGRVLADMLGGFAPLSDGRLISTALIDQVTDDTAVEPAPGMATYALARGTEVGFGFPGVHGDPAGVALSPGVMAPQEHAPLVAALQRVQGPVRIGDLPATDPAGARLDFVKGLIVRGYLRVAMAPQPSAGSPSIWRSAGSAWPGGRHLVQGIAPDAGLSSAGRSVCSDTRATGRHR